MVWNQILARGPCSLQLSKVPCVFRGCMHNCTASPHAESTSPPAWALTSSFPSSAQIPSPTSPPSLIRGRAVAASLVWPRGPVREVRLISLGLQTRPVSRRIVWLPLIGQRNEINWSNKCCSKWTKNYINVVVCAHALHFQLTSGIRWYLPEMLSAAVRWRIKAGVVLTPFTRLSRTHWSGRSAAPLLGQARPPGF